MTYKEQLKTEEWLLFRSKVLEYYENACCGCGGNKELHVHHKKYEKNRMAWEYGIMYMTVLCKSCHSEFHKNAIRIRELLTDHNLFFIGDARVVVNILEQSLKVQSQSRHEILKFINDMIDNQITF